jgi:predicted molibdopterin-dependent oxidoreductase YjgC
VRVESRRGAVEFTATLSWDVRLDTLFAPFHWGGKQAANVLTNPALDPTSRMPEFKVCAVRARAVGAEPQELTKAELPELETQRAAKPEPESQRAAKRETERSGT